jgi:hypothetical protein
LHIHDQKEDFDKHLKGIIASTCKYSRKKKKIFHTLVIAVEQGGKGTMRKFFFFSSAISECL